MAVDDEKAGTPEWHSSGEPEEACGSTLEEEVDWGDDGGAPIPEHQPKTPESPRSSGKGEPEDVEEISDGGEKDPQVRKANSAYLELAQKMDLPPPPTDGRLPLSWIQEQCARRGYAFDAKSLLRERPGVKDDPTLPDVPRAGVEGYVQATPVHWNTGVILSKANRNLWYQFIKKTIFERYYLTSATRADVQEALKAVGFADIQRELVADMPEPATTMGRTIGCYWHFDVRAIVNGTQHCPEEIMWRRGAQHAEWKVAYHGTALPNLPFILNEGFDTAVNTTQGKDGIYCEGAHRRENVINYMCHHAMPGTCPLLQWACVLELMVDRTRGRTVNGQWCQQPGSVAVSGCIIHCFNIARAYEQGFSGWYTVDRESLMCLGAMQYSAQMEQYLRDRVSGFIAGLPS